MEYIIILLILILALFLLRLFLPIFAYIVLILAIIFIINSIIRYFMNKKAQSYSDSNSTDRQVIDVDYTIIDEEDNDD